VSASDTDPAQFAFGGRNRRSVVAVVEPGLVEETLTLQDALRQRGTEAAAETFGSAKEPAYRTPSAGIIPALSGQLAVPARSMRVRQLSINDAGVPST
jgi:hypothetical protein